jgi:hypothetical protein
MVLISLGATDMHTVTEKVVGVFVRFRAAWWVKPQNNTCLTPSFFTSINV